MKKTLLLSEIFPPVKGGSGRWFWEVYNRLPSDRVVVAAGNNEQAAAFDKKNPLKTFRLPLSSTSWGLRSLVGLKFYWSVYWAVRKLVKQEKIEVIHCGRCLPEGFVAYLISKTMGIPYICYIHGEDVETAATSRELSWIVHRSLGGAEKLVCNSQNTADIVLNTWHASREKTHVVHPGVDAGYFVPAAPDAEVRDSLGWGQRPVVVTVGRLQLRKGQDMLIQALPEIRQQFPDILYAIIGEGEEKAALVKLAADLGVTDNVAMMSELSDEQMLQCYQQCDVFVLPNRTVGRDIEGFGMVLVEAQACAKPVIAGDSGGTAETMKVGETGYIVDCTSPAPLARQIIEVLSNLEQRKSMGAAGRQHVEQNLDWSKLAEQARQLMLTV
ncbi:glycosyl transferase family 1 [Hahella sp. CCB-MM4]|uniref:glycosyltransferase family 4 protein n=1 Tax=Hahella sp. (strain CCB-MM4) TaxID=1926491 RepID=UPI000B9A4FA4|nr:glycosyltransferase family 4 protein [Hahella sp. CCB-MM4]OZG73434.1 glycosyl transferase family 1 [Hahella sp. CCB-MM4]